MEHDIYLRAIKESLKVNGITYADLAKTLRMTESGVKKMLNAKDISFRRIVNICEALGILPGQLLAGAEKLSIRVHSLSDKQEIALLKDRRLLAVFWLMTVEQRSPQEMLSILKLDKKVLQVIQRRLVTLGLLSEGKLGFKPVFRGKFRWPDHSKIARQLNREWSELLVKRALSEHQATHRLATFRLTRKSSRDLREKLVDTVEDFARVSEREELTRQKADLQNVSVLVAAVDRGFFEEHVPFLQYGGKKA